MGRFRRGWQVLASNQRRLSRRFYSPSLLAEAYAAGQHIRRSRLCPGPSPSVRTGLGPRTGAENPRTRPVGAVTPAVCRLLASDLALQDSCSLLPSYPSSPGSDPGWVSWTPECQARRSRFLRWLVGLSLSLALDRSYYVLIFRYTLPARYETQGPRRWVPL